MGTRGSKRPRMRGADNEARPRTWITSTVRPRRPPHSTPDTAVRALAAMQRWGRTTITHGRPPRAMGHLTNPRRTGSPPQEDMAGDTAKGLEAAAGMDESLGVREALLTLGTTSRDLSMGAARTHTAQALLLTATAAAVVAADGVARGGPRCMRMCACVHVCACSRARALGAHRCARACVCVCERGGSKGGQNVSEMCLSLVAHAHGWAGTRCRRSRLGTAR